MQENIKNLNTDWKELLLSINDLGKIEKFIEEEKIKYTDLMEIFPESKNIFSAFNYFNIKDMKVLILGQDCYHQKNQANGLCFSVQDGIKIPPSLKNIFKELETDINFKIPISGNLESWANQGILLLNSSLSVRESSAGSHINIWEPFTDKIIKHISDNTEKIVFILWGNFAKKKKKFINAEKHFILEANHPSPLSANRGGWFGCQHFSKCNELLKSINKDEIDWQL